MATMQNIIVKGLREVGNAAMTAMGLFTCVLGSSAHLRDIHCSMYESACLMYTVYGREVSTDACSYLQLCSLPDERMSTPEAIAVYPEIRMQLLRGARLEPSRCWRREMR